MVSDQCMMDVDQTQLCDQVKTEALLQAIKL